MPKQQKAENTTGLLNTPYAASDLVSIIDLHLPYFEKLWKDGKENELYMEGINLTEKQKEVYRDAKRGHYPLPIASDKLTRIFSSQRSSRTSAKAEVSDTFSGTKAFPDAALRNEIKAELYTIRFRHIEKQNKIQNLVSKVFESGVGAKYGAIEVGIEHDNAGNDIITLHKRDYLDVLWDSNAKEYDKQDGTFFAHRKKVYRLDIRRDFGDKIADNITLNESSFGRGAKQNWGSPDRHGKRDNDIVYIYRIWIKVIRPTWHLIFGMEDISCQSKDEAEKLLRIKKLPYLVQDRTIPQIDIIQHDDYKIDYYETTLTQVLKYEETNLKFSPIEIYQSFHFEDRIWCFTDLLKPGNKLMDKLLAQVDHAIGVDVKEGWEIVTSWLEQGISVQDAIRKVKSGEPLPVIRPGALRPIQQHGFNAQWLQIFEIMQSLENQFTGGDLFSGAQQGRQRESEQAIAMKLKQQELIASLFISNLLFFQENLFRKIAWFISEYDTEESIQRIHAGVLTPVMMQLLQENNLYVPSPTKAQAGEGYIIINKAENQLSLLRDPNIDITIVEESINDSKRSTLFNHMLALEKSTPMLAMSPTWLNKKLELMDDVSYEEREKIKQEIQQAQQNQSQQAQQAQQQNINIQKAKVLAKAR